MESESAFEGFRYLFTGPAPIRPAVEPVVAPLDGTVPASPNPAVVLLRRTR